MAARLKRRMLPAASTDERTAESPKKLQGADMRTTVVQTVEFGREGHAESFLVSGWGAVAARYTPTAGEESILALPALHAPAGFLIALSFDIEQPLFLEVLLNGVPLGCRWIAKSGIEIWRAGPTSAPMPIGLTFRYPRQRRPGGSTLVKFRPPLGMHCQKLRLIRIDGPDAAPAPDDTLVPPNDVLAMEFTSLGDDCEFGLVQRALGAEPLGLLRFSASDLFNVARGIETNWEGLGERLSVAVEDGEWMTRELGYDLRWHTFMAPDKITADALLAKEKRKTEFLRRRLMAEIAGAERIFVVKSRDNPASMENVARLLRLLNRDAPNWILWVTADGIPGHVELVAPRLLRGHVTRFALPGPAINNYVFADWLSVLRRAWLLARGPWRETRPPAADAEDARLEAAALAAAIAPVTDADPQAGPDQKAAGGMTELLFGFGGNDRPWLISGWSGDEPGIRWAIDHESRFAMTLPGDATHYLLELDFHTATEQPGLPALQRIGLRVDGKPVARTAIGHNTTIAFGFARPDMNRTLCEFTLDLPDAVRPSDTSASGDDRLLAIAMIRARVFPARPVARFTPTASFLTLPSGLGREGLMDATRRLAGRPVVELVSQFESIGHDCELGLFQRMCGAEPAGLFRFGDIDCRFLIRGLDMEFAAIADKNQLSAVLNTPDGDFHVHHDQYGFRYHTFAFAKETTAEAVVARHARLLPFSRRTLFERIANSERVFVFKRTRPTADAEGVAILRALRAHGPAPFLYVVPADRDHPSGLVEVVEPGCLKGYLSRFWTQGMETIPFRSWLELCLNANALLNDASCVNGHR